MSPVILLSIVLQIACCVHVVRTGRPLYWVFILLVFSYLAVLVYVIAEILPDLRHNPSARRTVRSVRDRIDPERDKRDAARLLQAVDTPENAVAWPKKACAEATTLTPPSCTSNP
jgi:hypothetical protein